MAAAVTANGASFSLVNVRDSRTYGPFDAKNGARAVIAGVPYSIQVTQGERVSFTSVATGAQWGPLQLVEGRLGVIGNGTYKVVSVTSTPAQGGNAAASAGAAHDPFVPAPPAMPQMIDIPEQQPKRTVAPLDLPSLPKARSQLRVAGWIAPIDNTPVDWKIASKGAGDGAIERTSFGAEIDWRGWGFAASVSPMVKCDGIVADGTGLSGVSIEDGTGWAASLGYKRPFLVEGGWSALAGVRGLVRKDSGDLKSSSLVSTGETDTNMVGNVKSEYRSSKSSADITEISFWIDLELAYEGECWGTWLGLSIEPVCEYDVSGHIPFGGDKLSLKAKQSTPIAGIFGGWYEYEGVRFFADVAVGANRLVKIGCSHDF
jgi:hypothetical protein